MYDDPIVAEIRRLREQYAKRFGYDLDLICRDLREQQQREGRRVVRRRPRRPADLNATPNVTEPIVGPDGGQSRC